MSNKSDKLLAQAIEIEYKTKLLLDSVLFTTNLIDKLPDDFEPTRETEMLMARLKIDYVELKKSNTVYNKIVEQWNKLEGVEKLPELPDLEDLDFTL